MIPFSPPNIGEEEIGEVADTLRSGWITTGPKTRLFETEFARFVGAPAALGLNSCTAGLHLSLVAHGIKPGDLVATTPMTFAATVNVIEHVGATPLLVDIDPETLNISTEALRASINDDVRAIMVVHYAGHPVDMTGITAIARQQGIPLIEDAAHALPATHDGRIIGSHGNLTAFSFYATKNITTGEGGMLTGNPDLIEAARVMSLHGMSKDAARRYETGGTWQYEVLAPGFKYNMTDIQAALGLCQLRRVEEFQRNRRRIVDLYNESFSDMPQLILPRERADVSSALHLYVLRLRTEMLRIDRDEFSAQLRAQGIATSVHFIPIHLHPYYRDKYSYGPEDYPVAYEVYRRIVSLPLYSRMTEDEARQVVAAVRDLVTKHRAD